jgi:DNA-directed RNA polymerase specialized sigma24 family protein
MTALDSTFAQVRAGDRLAFAHWMGSVELPIRLSLRQFARAVDVEAVVQETLLRMWILAQDGARPLTGDNASLRFSIGLARNLARAEARRLGNETLLPLEALPEPSAEPEPPSDPPLREAILECLARLATKPAKAFQARMRLGARFPDAVLASRLGMSLNTFLQNIVRARKQVATCLARKGIPLEEVL